MSTLRSLFLTLLLVPLLATAQQMPTPPALAAKSWLLLASGALLLGTRQWLKHLHHRSPS